MVELSSKLEVEIGSGGTKANRMMLLAVFCIVLMAVAAFVTWSAEAQQPGPGHSPAQPGQAFQGPPPGQGPEGAPPEQGGFDPQSMQGEPANRGKADKEGLSNADKGLSSEDEGPRLYQLLHDQHFTEPMNELGQQVRIWIWLDWMDFDISQLRRLQRLGDRFHKRVRTLNDESRLLLEDYEGQLVVHYQDLYDLLRADKPDPKSLDDLAKRLSVSALSTKRDEALRKLRIEALRSILADEKEFLYTLSPDQQQRLVSSLFFLRNEIDPFANPGTYRNIIGPTWNAGDFTALLRDTHGDDHLNIGGLWGIREGQQKSPNYAHIKRSVVLFYVLKQPMLAPTANEMLELKREKMRRAAALKGQGN